MSRKMRKRIWPWFAVAILVALMGLQVSGWLPRWWDGFASGLMLTVSLLLLTDALRDESGKSTRPDE